MKNVKIGNKEFDGVNYVACKCANVAGQRFAFLDNDEAGKPTDVATEAEMTALLVEANVGKAYRFTGATTYNYINGDIYIVEAN